MVTALFLSAKPLESVNVPVTISSSLYFLSVTWSMLIVQSAFSTVSGVLASDGLYLSLPSYATFMSPTDILFIVVVKVYDPSFPVFTGVSTPLILTTT